MKLKPLKTNRIVNGKYTFRVNEWMVEDRNYPTCKCGNKYVKTHHKQKDCLFCLRKKDGNS